MKYISTIALAAALGFVGQAQASKLTPATDLLLLVKEAKSQADIPKQILQAGGAVMASFLTANCLATSDGEMCLKAISVLEAVSVVTDGKDSPQTKTICAIGRFATSGYWFNVREGLKYTHTTAVFEGNSEVADRYEKLIAKVNAQLDAVKKVCT